MCGYGAGETGKNRFCGEGQLRRCGSTEGSQPFVPGCRGGSALLGSRGNAHWRVEGSQPHRVKGETPCPGKVDACVNLYWTKVYFVRHAQPEHDWEEDITRPLTEEGKKDSEIVLEFLKDKKIDAFYCSPYKRSMDTIAEAAAFFAKEIITDERLREREKGPDGNNHGMFQKRWADHDYHEDGGESIAMVQNRNIEALNEILSDNTDKEIVIGTHGTALSTILNFYDNSFGCEEFLRIIDWMPYIIELDFEGDKLVGKQEHCHVEKEFKGNQRADKK